MQSVHVRATTLTDYTSKVRRHIIAELGDKRMGEVSLDDIQLALVPVSKKSASVYKSVVILYKSIFRAAMESRIIDHNPTIYLTTKGCLALCFTSAVSLIKSRLSDKKRV